MRKMTFNDIRDGVAAAKHYGLKPQQMEREIRRHLEGASDKELKKTYEEFFKQPK